MTRSDSPTARTDDERLRADLVEKLTIAGVVLSEVDATWEPATWREAEMIVAALWPEMAPLLAARDEAREEVQRAEADYAAARMTADQRLESLRALRAEAAGLRRQVQAVRELCEVVENRMMATAKPSEIRAALAVAQEAPNDHPAELEGDSKVCTRCGRWESNGVHL